MSNLEKIANDEWLEKTEWVQERKDWPFQTLGMHWADVMKKYIEYLERELTSVSPLLIKLVRLSEAEILELADRFGSFGYSDDCAGFAKAIMDAMEAKNK